MRSPPPQNVKFDNFPVFHTDRVIIDRLTRGQGQPSRIWKVQYDWLSLGKGLLLSVEQALAGRNEIRTPLKIKTPARDRRLYRIVCMRSFGNVDRVLRLILEWGLRFSPGNCILKNCENKNKQINK